MFSNIRISCVLCSVIYVKFYNFFNNTSLCRHLSAQGIVNWVTTADGCVHTAATVLSRRRCVLVDSHCPQLTHCRSLSNDDVDGCRQLDTLSSCSRFSDSVVGFTGQDPANSIKVLKARGLWLHSCDVDLISCC